MVQLDERAAVRRLHDRLGVGPRPGDLDRSYDAALDALLSGGAAGVAPPQLASPPRPAKGDDQAKKEAARRRAEDEQALAVWWLDRLVSAGSPAAERMTWFWHGHFATSEQKVRSPALMLAQNETFRRLGLGPFADLAQALVVDPAMLVWLDGNDNRVGAANENLARELMELFTLGIGNYDEVDVREAARSLTGWTVRADTGKAELVAKRRDDGAKRVFGKTDRYTAQSLMTLILDRPESPEFVVGRVWFRLVSAQPPARDVLDRLVSAFRRDTRSLLRALASEAAFRDPANVLVKQPVDWAVGLMRALGVKPLDLNKKQADLLLRSLRGLGQVPFRPPSVGGWPAGGAWLTTAAWPSRLDLAKLVAERADLKSALGGADEIEGVRRLLGVDSWSDRSKAALQKVEGNPVQLVVVAASAPEYVVSR
ncbi:DUF1800 family protein [Lentzea sp. HUAS12]|uniref:DUF1800 domain-containing protein n=1 Tax=Lentzea sp. HUAS12 TaxID=2951806 RepID=UPI00209FE691|nr:DUF1800 domain-containing protein [Lentzea sp. HUAS12]USX53564.1 DUF1800 domain-containing protein [Lentzea sp. HUAS12]